MAQVEKVAIHTQHDAAAVVARIVELRGASMRTAEQTAEMERLQSLRKRMWASLGALASPTDADKAALAILRKRIK